MPRGGSRKGAGRKTAWESGCTFAETTVIRVPKYLKNEVLELAHRLDAGEEVDLVSKSIKERNNYLEGKVLGLEKKLLNQTKSLKEKVTKSKNVDKQGQLDLVTESEIKMSGIKLSEKRFNLNKAAAVKSKKRNSINKFIEWSRSKDPDDIPWIPVEGGYIPHGVLSVEVQNKLRIWIENN